MGEVEAVTPAVALEKPIGRTARDRPEVCTEVFRNFVQNPAHLISEFYDAGSSQRNDPDENSAGLPMLSPQVLHRDALISDLGASLLALAIRASIAIHMMPA